MADLNSLYGGYLAKSQLNRQEEAQGLQSMGALQGLLMKAQAMEEQKRLASIVSQTGGDANATIQKLLSVGTPQAIELASKLKGMVPDPDQAAQRRAQTEKLNLDNAAARTRNTAITQYGDLFDPSKNIHAREGMPLQIFQSEDAARNAAIEHERKYGHLPADQQPVFRATSPNPKTLSDLLMKIDPAATVRAQATAMNRQPERPQIVPGGAGVLRPGETTPGYTQPFAPRAETPRTEFAKLNEDLKAGRITQEQFDAASRTRLGDTSVIPEEHSTLRGEDYLKTLPQGMQNTIKGIVEGRVPITSFSIRNNQRDAMLQRAMQYDPTFEAGKAPARMAVQKDFTSGPAARNVTAINTAIRHMGTLDDLGRALDTGDIQAVNRAINFVRNQFGDERVNNFNTAKSAVGTELMRVFRQVGASLQETRDWEDKFNAAQSPTQMRGVIKTGVELLDGRIKALDEQWMRGMDSDKGYPNLITPTANDILGRIGGNPRRREGDSKGGTWSNDKERRYQELLKKRAEGG